MADETLTRDVALNVLGKIDGYAKTLGEMPGVTQKAAAKAALAMQKTFTNEFVTLAKKADKEAKEVADSYGDAFGKMGSVAEKTFGKLGGIFGELGDAVFDFVLPLGEAAGGLEGVAAAGLAGGAAFTAAAAGAALLVVGAKSLADGAIEARDRLKEMGLESSLPPESLHSLESYESATGTLSVALDKLEVIVGGALADDLAVLARTTADVVDWTTKASNSTSEWADTLSHLNPLLGATIDFYGGLWGEQKKVTQAEIELDRAQAEAAANEAGRRDAEKRGNQQLTKQRASDLHSREDAAKKYAAASAEAVKAERLWRDEAEETFNAANVADYVAAWDPMLLQLNAIIGASSELSDEWDELSAHMDEVGEEVQKRLQQRADGLAYIWETSKEAVKQFTDDVLSLQADARAKDLDGARKDRDKHKALIDDLYAQRAEASTKAELAEIDTRIATQEAKSQSYNQEVQDAKRRSQNVAKAQKAAALVGIGVDTAEAVIKAFAMFGPPPSPVGIGAAAAALAAGGLQAGIVAATPLPTFFVGTGRVPGAGSDPVGVTAHGGEGMLNKRATDNAGPEFIDALNAGFSPLEALRGTLNTRVSNVPELARAIGREVARASTRGSKPTGYRSPYGRN